MNEFQELLRNPAHWGFEAVTDIVFGIIVFIFGSITPEKLNPFKRWITRHDREHHGEPHRPLHFKEV